MIEHLEILASDLENFLKYYVMPLMGVAFVIWVGSKTKGSIVATIVAGFGAAVAWWVVINMEVIRDSSDEDLNPEHRTSSSAPLDPSGGAQ